MHLSVDQIRLNHLRKQFLFSETAHDFFTLTQRHLGLHSTDYWSPYLSAFARIGQFDAAQVYRALNQGQQIARIHAFRGAVHIVHEDNLALIIAATGPRLYRLARKAASLRNLSDQQVETMLDHFLAALEDQPLPMRELKQALPELAPQMRPLLYLVMATGQVVRATTPHARSPLSTYTLMKHRFPGLKIQQYTEDEAITQLIHRYIELFGPVSVNDIAWWLPTTKKQTLSSLTNWAQELVEIQINGDSKFMTKPDAETAQALTPRVDPIIAFLPYEDYFAKAFIDRTWYITPEHQDRLFPRTAQSHWPKGTTPKRAPAPTTGINQSGEIRPSIWLNTQIIGRWELGETKEGITVSYDLYTHVRQQVQATIQAQKQQLETFLNNQLLPISKASKQA